MSVCLSDKHCSLYPCVDLSLPACGILNVCLVLFPLFLSVFTSCLACLSVCLSVLTCLSLSVCVVYAYNEYSEILMNMYFIFEILIKIVEGLRRRQGL